MQCISRCCWPPATLQTGLNPSLHLIACVACVQFEVLDQKIDASLAKLFEARRRRDMYLGFAEDPVTFLNTIIASQVS